MQISNKAAMNPLNLSSYPADYSDLAQVKVTHEGYILYLDWLAVNVSPQTMQFINEVLTDEQKEYLGNLTKTQQVAAVFCMLNGPHTVYVDESS